ncbi:MAG: ATP synthase F1 subunit delta [Chitinophagales bacterium]|jgi:F-type H+-transporting ATPase subunit delta
MSVTRIATRYAKSLIDLSSEQGKLEQVYADMRMLQSAVKNRDLYLFLKSPVIHADKKIAIFSTLFKEKMDSLTLAYMNLLANKGREGYLADICTEFVNQYKLLKHITTVKVITAVPLEEALLADLRQKVVASGITFDNLEIQPSVDPNLIGGFVLEFDNKRYDASVASKLEELKNQFSKNLYIKEF